MDKEKGPGAVLRNESKKIHDLMERIGRPVRLMEVCGTHTMAVFRHGIRSMLPEGLSLLSGPGCPVCVTPVGDIDAAISLAMDKGVILTTFGDMMRVPGSKASLAEARAQGADIRVVYSPLEALEAADRHKDREVVFFATGFETTSPLVAATILEAEDRGIRNFTILCVHKLVPPALRALLNSGDVQVDGFILPGPVSAIIGSRPYGFLVEEYRKPSVITGFEARDILTGIEMIMEQIASGTARIGNQYARVVREEGNPKALSILRRVFDVEDARWRGIGTLPDSGLRPGEAFLERDALTRFGLDTNSSDEPSACDCGEVLKGMKVPTDCRLFGKACTPEKPVGACMVSTEGSCAAYYRYMPR